MAVTYFEIIVKGSAKLLKGFVRGYEIGRSIKGGLYYCADHPIDTRHLRDILAFHGDHIHLMCRTSVRQVFLAAIEQAADLDLELVSDVRVAGTSFEFEFDTYSREVASEIKRLVKTLPAGLERVDYEPKETVDEKARGTELYSPVHEYRFRGKGRIAGDFEKLLSFHETLAANTFIDVGDIAIER